MTQTIVNLGTGGAALNGRNGSTTGADSNDALFLAPEDTGYAYLPGVAANRLTVPDEAALDITGDIDIRVQVALGDWTPAANNTLLSKWGTQRSIILRINTSGTVSFIWTTDGTGGTVNTRTSTTATAVTDGATKWVRATLDVDNGASGHDVKFWLSDDGTTWAQLGTTVTTAGVTSIFAGTAQLAAGVTLDASDPLTGKLYRAVIYSDLTETTKVLDIDCDAITSGSQTSFTALTGQTVTINRSTSGRKTVAVPSLLNGGSPVWLFGTDDFMEVANNALLNFGASDSFTVLAVVRRWPNNAAGGIIQKANNTSSTMSGWSLYDGGLGVYSFRYGNGSSRSIINSGNFTTGIVQIVGAVRSIGGNNVINVYPDPTPVNSGAAPNLIPTTNPVRVGQNLTEYAAMELYAVAVFRRALTATEISAITTYYQARVS